MDSFFDFLRRNGVNPNNTGEVAPGCENLLIAVNGEKKKNVYISLSEDGRFGRYFSCKTGDGGWWHEKSSNQNNRVDQAELKAEMAERKKRYEAARREAQKEAANLAAEKWALCDIADDSHPYLKKKGVKAYNLGIEKTNLLVPMYHKIGGGVIGLQSITPDGAKYFGKDTAKQGSFNLIGNKKDTIYICEVYSTGASVYEATGHATAVAFDA